MNCIAKLLFTLTTLAFATASPIPGCPSLYDPDTATLESFDPDDPDALMVEWSGQTSRHQQQTSEPSTVLLRCVER